MEESKLDEAAAKDGIDLGEPDNKVEKKVINDDDVSILWDCEFSWNISLKNKYAYSSTQSETKFWERQTPNEIQLG